MRSKLYAVFMGIVLSATPAHAQAEAEAPMSPVVTAVDTQSPRVDTSIVPLDHLAISVFREPELSVADVMVDEGGRVALPLVGAVDAAGKSTDVLSAEISGKLRQYLKDPQVAVVVKQPASRRVTVTGSVTLPGVYPLETRLTLLQAVALARGPSSVASLDQAFIFRTKNGQRTAARFNLDTIARGKSNDPEVISGDTVALGSSHFKTAWRDILSSVHAFNVFNVLSLPLP